MQLKIYLIHILAQEGAALATLMFMNLCEDYNKVTNKNNS